MKYELDLFKKIATQLIEKEHSEPVSEYINPEKLDELFISLNNDPVNEKEFTETLTNLVLSTPKINSKKFFNQLFGGRNNMAALGDLLAVLLNNSMYTYKVAGVQVGIEREIINKVCQIINYPTDSAGTIAPGGSSCNLMAMIMARDAFNEAIKFEGLKQKLIVYTSKDSHYSIAKNAAFIGIGRKNVRYIPTNNKGELMPSKLEKQIEIDKENNLFPFFINATAGTTVFGAFDPIEEIVKISTKHKLWLHIDGAYCGPVIFSKNYKNQVKGIEKSDSFCFNAHKILSVPLTCSVFVTKNKKQLHESFANEADYLYQTEQDEFNLGKTSLQCGRRNDALKFWTLWKYVGTKGLGEMVDKLFNLANIARNYIRNNPDYKLYSFDNTLSVCFSYKHIDSQKLCTLLHQKSELLVGFGKTETNTFVRLVLVNSENSEGDILDFFKTIEAFVEKNQFEL